MSEIELVIKIPEGVYKHIKNTWRKRRGSCPESYIAWGIPLPKGHGRLIDETEADGLIAEGKDGNKSYFGTVNKDWEVIDFLKTVPTIIEAERNQENDK